MTPQQKQYFMKLKTSKERILKVNKSLKALSGIYIFWRTDLQTNKKIVYIGQSTNILRRCAEHLLGYQAIDLSIKKHGLFDPIKNKEGYYVKALEYCESKYLDEKEKKYIRVYSDKPYVELKNITSGGQDEGHIDLNYRKASKGYRDGLEQGYSNCLKEVREFFDKYLTFAPKQEFKKSKKKSDPPQLKDIYVKKYNEFKELLNGKDNNTMDSQND